MNELTVINHAGVLVTDSREVARMIGKRHADLLETITGYASHLLNGNFRLVDFFIKSSYRDSTGRELPCWLLTRKGCDMVANKMTGEKGVLFTAAYVTKFEEMEHDLNSKPYIPAEIMKDPIMAMRYEQIKMEQRLASVEDEQGDIKVQAATAQEQAELANERINALDAIDPNGTPRQQLIKLVNRYSEKNGLMYAEGWRKFREAYNIAGHTNVKTLANNYMKKHGIRKMTIPEYLESAGKIQDGLRVADKMLHPNKEAI